jgi:uncharacterized protein involved in exopolysaccharide biosynthesis
MSTSEPNDQKQIIYVPAFPPGFSKEQGDDEIDLLELWKVIWNGKWFIAGFTLACTLIAVYVTLFVMPIIYKSEAVLMPTETQGGGGLAGLAASLPIPISLPGGGGKADNIAAFLNSRNLQERLLTKYDLLPRFYPDIWDGDKNEWIVEKEEDKPTVIKTIQEGILKSIYKVNQEKLTNLITLSWEDQDPAFAALMLDRIIAELQHYLDHEYDTDAKRERQFVEQQLANATRDLENWEQKVPSLNMPLTRIQRERLAAQTVYTELRKQVELARISEAKELIRFKVLDAPYVPEQRFKPKRTLICAITLVASGMLSVCMVFGFNATKNRVINN